MEVELDPSVSETTLLQSLKALADETRLNIIALLLQGPHTGEQLAALLDLRPSTISHHLARLRQAGLVRAEAESYYSVYHFNSGSLELIALRLRSTETFWRLADSLYQDAHARMQPKASQRGGVKSRSARR
jgi:DNA-binding transcriptional ArsR family regulator